MLLCMLNYMCHVSGRVWAVTVPPVVFQCRLQKLEFLQWHPSVGRIQLSFSSGIPVWGCFNYVFQWCSSVPCKYSLGGPVVSQCTLGHAVAFQWHSTVHWTSQCTLAQGKGTVFTTALRGDCRSTRQAMMTSSYRNIFRVTGHSPVTGECEFPTQRTVTRSFDVFFDLRVNERLSKQWWGWWFETQSPPLWRHCNKH